MTSLRVFFFVKKRLERAERVVIVVDFGRGSRLGHEAEGTVFGAGEIWKSGFLVSILTAHGDIGGEGGQDGDRLRNIVLIEDCQIHIMLKLAVCDVFVGHC